MTSPMWLVAAIALVIAPLIGWALVLADEGYWKLPAVLLIVGLVPVLVRWPLISTFGIYALLVPFDSVAVLAEGRGATLTRLIGIMAGAVMLGAGLVERRLVRPPAAALWWGLFALWAVLSVVWAVDPDLVRARLMTMLSLMALYLVAVSFRATPREFSWVCILTVLGGVMAAATGYFLGFEEDAEGLRTRGRLTIGDEYKNPNTLAGVLILPLALGIGGFIGFRGLLTRAVTIAAVGLMTFGLFITMSRAAVLALASMLLVFLYRFRKRSPILIVVAVSLGLAGIMPEAFFERISSIFGGGRDTTGAGRLDIWEVGVKALNEYWAIGAGLSNYVAVHGREVAYGPEGTPRPAHNTYLSTWVELGIVGLGLMLAAVVSHLVAPARTRGLMSGAGIALRGIEAACFGTLVSAFFADVLWRKSFWMPWILLVWATRLARGPSLSTPQPEEEGGSLSAVSTSGADEVAAPGKHRGERRASMEA